MDITDFGVGVEPDFGMEPEPEHGFEPESESMSGPMTEPMTEPMIESMTEPMTEPIPEPEFEPEHEFEPEPEFWDIDLIEREQNDGIELDGVDFDIDSVYSTDIPDSGMKPEYETGVAEAVNNVQSDTDEEDGAFKMNFKFE